MGAADGQTIEGDVENQALLRAHSKVCVARSRASSARPATAAGRSIDTPAPNTAMGTSAAVPAAARLRTDARLLPIRRQRGAHWPSLRGSISIIQNCVAPVCKRYGFLRRRHSGSNCHQPTVQFRSDLLRCSLHLSISALLPAMPQSLRGIAVSASRRRPCARNPNPASPITHAPSCGSARRPAFHKACRKTRRSPRDRYPQRPISGSHRIQYRRSGSRRHMRFS